MPAAVGIALAKPQQKVIAVIGDGSSMYAIQALWSAAHLRLPITFVILKNRRYAALQDFSRVFGYREGEKVEGTDLPDIDFVALAKGQGCDGVRVSDAAQLAQVLQEALFHHALPTADDLRRLGARPWQVDFLAPLMAEVLGS